MEEKAGLLILSLEAGLMKDHNVSGSTIDGKCLPNRNWIDGNLIYRQ